MDHRKPRRKAESETKRGIPWPRWTGFRGKTVWDWLQLLIVPLALAVIGYWFTMQQEDRQRQIEEQRDAQAQKIENQRAAAERTIQQQNAQDEALQAYLDQMSNLLIEKDLRASEEDSEVRTLARARTATMIQRLDADGNRNVIRFLNEARLTGNGQSSMRLLAGADLHGARLEGVELSATDLSGANLSDAFLEGAFPSNANLRDVQGVTHEALRQRAYSLEGATMPNGQKYEEWLKSKGRREDGENTGSS